MLYFLILTAKKLTPLHIAVICLLTSLILGALGQLIQLVKERYETPKYAFSIDIEIDYPQIVDHDPELTMTLT